MRFEAIETTIERILELNYFNEDKVYGLEEFNIFQPISNLDTWGMDIETEDKIRERNYVLDQCNDGRSRALKVILYNDIPFALYQYIGKGNIENEVIFNKEVYGLLLNDYISEYIQKIGQNNVANITDEYIIENYNMAYFELVDNSLIAKSDYN